MFKRAERQQVKLKIGISGPSGSGKTLGALILASAIGKKIAVIDTENGSASLYGDRFEFDTAIIRPPYTVQKFLESVRMAERSGYDVVVVDSISHEWQGDGSLLAKKEQLDANPKTNHFANWAPISKEHNQFIGMILNSSCHMICTMRSKQDYIIVENDRGKQAPQKVGMSPVQREGIEYEFSTVFDIDMTHSAAVSKDRTGLFDGQRFKITAETGDAFVKWLSNAKPAEVIPQVEQKEEEPKSVATAPPKSSIPDPFEKPAPTEAGSGVACHCGGQALLHPNKSGYLCENAKAKGDGHLRFLTSQLQQYRNKQSNAVSSKGA